MVILGLTLLCITLYYVKIQIIRSLRECRGELVSSQKQFEFCHKALEEIMWGRPASQEELDTWEALANHKGKKGKKWKVFGMNSKEKSKEAKVSQQVTITTCITVESLD